MIEVERLSKTFRVPVKQPGLAGSLRSLWHREIREVRAVDAISFAIAPGERVGFLGPNGAGKTTTLKMLCGLLHPTSGTCRVNGFRPQDRRREGLKTLTLVMGQKQQLLWDLPAIETFALNRALYDIPHSRYRDTLAELSRLLELGPFLDRPVRTLSLGQRMRAELAAALLHEPQTLFLDEPTIGMDVEVQALVREFLVEYNRRREATIVLTSHDMADVSSIAQRILLIDGGVLRYNGDLLGLHRQFGNGRRVVVRGPEFELVPLGFVRDAHEEHSFVATVPAEDVNRLLQRVLQQIPQADVSVGEPPLAEVLRTAFGASATGART